MNQADVVGNSWETNEELPRRMLQVESWVIEGTSNMEQQGKNIPERGNR